MNLLVSLPTWVIYAFFVIVAAAFAWGLSVYLHGRFKGKAARSMGDAAAVQLSC